MASTNKTPNLNLSQFIATDKPAWLTDVNGDMSKIDTAVKNVSDRVGVNETAITEAEANIEDNASNITTLQASSSQHGTDITDLKAQDIIIKNDVTNLGTRVGALENKINCELLWTSPNPDASQSSFTINVNLSSYKLIVVVARGVCNSTGTPYVSSICVPGTYSYVSALIGGQLRGRWFTLYDDRIEVGTGYTYATYGGSATVDTYMCTPYQIYGIK